MNEKYVVRQPRWMDGLAVVAAIFGICGDLFVMINHQEYGSPILLPSLCAVLIAYMYGVKLTLKADRIEVRNWIHTWRVPLVVIDHFYGDDYLRVRLVDGKRVTIMAVPANNNIAIAAGRPTKATRKADFLNEWSAPVRSQQSDATGVTRRLSPPTPLMIGTSIAFVVIWALYLGGAFPG